MKKLLFVLLTAALALPMMAQRMDATKVTTMRDRNETVTFAPLKAFDATNQVFNRAESYLWDFETDESMEGWMALDNDGDGYGWEVDDYNSYPDGSYCLTSRSYYSGTVLYPDNWLISPMVTFQNELSIFAANYLGSYPDVFAVYVYVGNEEDMTIDGFVQVSEDIAPPSSWTEYKFDLSEYAGQTGCFAIRHYNSVDQYRLLIDYISMYTPIPPMAMPENLTAEPASTTAEVAWEGPEDATGYNLRYRPYSEPTGYFWDFEEPQADDYAAPAGWTTLDEDGDGYNWMHFNNTNAEWACHSGYGHMTSESYVNYVGALYPDNWLVSPKVVLQGNLSFWAAGQDPSYAAEVFGVYVSTDRAEWIPLAENVVATGEVTEYVYDLSAYEGQEGYVAIRHYNVTDMFRLNIDDVMIGTPSEEAEWVVVEGATSPYTIEGLDPETTYEVQVMAYNDEQETDWTESVIFTTVSNQEPPTPEDPHMTGKWIVFINQDNEEVWYAMNDDPEGENNWFLMLTLHHYPWNENVPFYFMVDGVQMGAETDMYEPQMGDNTQTILNPVFEGENMFTVPSTYTYTFGLQLQDGQYYLLVAQGPQTAVNEINGGKTVSSVRYFNVAGQEMQEANGMTIVVTTYTDGTTSAAKVIK